MIFIDNITIAIERIYKFSKAKPKEFAGMCGVGGSIAWIYIRALWFVFYMGKLNVYGISAGNVDVQNETLIGQTLLAVSIIALCLFSNVICYEMLRSVITGSGSNKIVKKIMIFLSCVFGLLFFFAFETVVLLVMIMFSEGYQWQFDLILLSNSSFYLAIKSSLFLVVAINSFGISGFIVSLFKGKRNGRKGKDDENNNKYSFKQIVMIAITSIIIMATVLCYMYIVGQNLEYTRINCNVVVEKDEQEVRLNGINSLIPVGIKLRPIVYENKDYYFVSEFVMKGGKICIEEGRYTTIPKEGKEIFKLDRLSALGEKVQEWYDKVY